MVTISNKGATQGTCYHPEDSHGNLQATLRCLTSGKRLLGKNDEIGSLAISMKVKASSKSLSGAQDKINNALSFLIMIDGMVETTGKVLKRMSKLKSCHTQHLLKSDKNKVSYYNEFKDLQYQLYQIPEMNLNGMSLFTNFVAVDDSRRQTSGDETVSGWKNQESAIDFRPTILSCSGGYGGRKVRIHKSFLLPSLTLRQTIDIYSAEDVAGGTVAGSGNSSERDIEKQHLARSALDADTGFPSSTNNTESYLTLTVEFNATINALNLSQASSGVSENALESVIYLRSQLYDGMSRPRFELETIQSQQINMIPALVRIPELDVGAISERFAKQSTNKQKN